MMSWIESAIAALLCAMFFTGSPAQALEGSPRLIALRVDAAADGTRLDIDLSGATSFRMAAKANPDRVELDFPTATWPSSLAASGAGAGFVSVYRRATAPGGGIRIVLETTTPVKIESAGMGLAAPGQPRHFELVLESADGLPVPGKTPVIAESLGAALPVPLLAAAPVPRRPRTEIRHIVAIDPGHGGIDPGTASAGGVFEKAITLQTGLILKTALEATGRYRVVMTRTSDTFIPLEDRVRIARQAGAELFISLHCDAMEGRDAEGATIYTLSDTASDAVSERLATKENRAAAIGGVNLAREDDGTAGLLIDMSMHDSVNRSNRFAALLVGEFGDHGIGLQELKPHRAAGFAVLKAADMPSVLIEMGYLSNPQDAELLGEPAHQRAIAGAIAEGVDRYFGTGGGHKS